MPKNGYIVGLDIGTKKVTAIIGEITEERKVEVIGIGTADSKGLRKGVVVNLDVTSSAIKKAQEEAELMAGVEIGSAFVGISGAHIKSFNSRGVIAVSGKNPGIVPAKSGE
jgi:cell division protein FtsA